MSFFAQTDRIYSAINAGVEVHKFIVSFTDLSLLEGQMWSLLLSSQSGKQYISRQLVVNLHLHARELQSK